jgi:hypothetical protein
VQSSSWKLDKRQKLYFIKPELSLTFVRLQAGDPVWADPRRVHYAARQIDPVARESLDLLIAFWQYPGNRSA